MIKNKHCFMDWIILGLLAGAITSMGFVPQLVKGYRTRKLEDISYYMPLVLVVGMLLWLIYGVIQGDLAIIIANAVGVSCNMLLLTMKKIYAGAAKKN